MGKMVWGLTLLVLLTACSDSDKSSSDSDLSRSIVILYENDVHGGIDGYTKLAGLRDAIANSDTAWVATVSSGDFLQGSVSAAITKGQGVVDIMRSVGYDAVTLGNHEFDYLVPRMVELLPQLNAPIVCANFFEYGAVKPYYEPYVIKTFGNKKIAFVGACTPETMRSESYAFFDKDGKQIYDLKTNEVYSLVQAAADKARSEGADYVVLLSHLGEDKKETGIFSHGLVEATKGIDVVLDGHTHAVIEGDKVKNLDGKEIIVTQTGTQFANVGKLLITKDGQFFTQLIPTSEIPYESAAVTSATQKVKTDMESVVATKVATTDYDLVCKDADGKWLVRNRETNLGDLIADAYRQSMKADIGLQNGGGIRNGIAAGTITFGDVFNVLPNDNLMCKIKATGAQILAMLEKVTAKCPLDDGSFPQVSGIAFTIHNVSHKVSDVKVVDASGQYQPLDAAKTYTIATNDYYSQGGFYRTLQDCKLLESTATPCRDCVANYLKDTLGGKTGTAYANPQGRVTIKED